MYFKLRDLIFLNKKYPLVKVSKNFKTLFKLNPLLFNESKLSTLNNKKIILNLNSLNEVKILSLFKVYYFTNYNVHSPFFRIHSSMTSYYIKHTNNGSAVINVKKLFHKWKDFYYLLVNIFYYNIKFITFGTIFFKNEVLSLNWLSMSSLRYLWKYTNTFFYFKSFKINNLGTKFFYKLRLSNLNIALVLNLLYHSKTIYYLNRVGFYIIGPVPLNYNLYTLDFSIPISIDNIFMELFFLRFIYILKKEAHYIKYNVLLKYWVNNFIRI